MKELHRPFVCLNDVYGSDSDSNGIKFLQTAVRYPTHPFLFLTPAICIYLMVVMELWN